MINAVIPVTTAPMIKRIPPVETVIVAIATITVPATINAAPPRIKTAAVTRPRVEIILVKKGVSDRKGKMNFFGDDNFGNMINIHNSKLTQKIEVIDLDSFIKENDIPKINYIKSDIESSEIEMLKGLKKSLINKKIENLVIASYHIRDNKRTYIICEDILRKYNHYKIKTIFTTGGSSFVTYSKLK